MPTGGDDVLNWRADHATPANDARRQLHNILYNLVTIFKPHASGIADRYSGTIRQMYAVCLANGVCIWLEFWGRGAGRIQKTSLGGR